MNAEILAKLKKGIAIALKQFPWLKAYDKRSGIYLWERYNEEGKYCWYVGKAKNILRRTAQHIVDGQSHLDKSIKKHGLTNDTVEKPNSWSVDLLMLCEEKDLDRLEQSYISQWKRNNPNGIMYNVESGGTTGKTIIGEKKQRRDVKWRAEARAKVIAEYRKYFHIIPTQDALKKGTGELKAEPQKLKDEFYNDKKIVDFC